MQNEDNAKHRKPKGDREEGVWWTETNTQPERFMNKLHEHKVIKTVVTHWLLVVIQRLIVQVIRSMITYIK